MKNLTIKNLPEPIYRRLKAMAATNRRSLNSEVIHRLERSVGLVTADPDALIARARAVRERSVSTYLTDDVLRASREEGRA